MKADIQNRLLITRGFGRSVSVQMALLMASYLMVKPINGRNAVSGNPCFKTAFNWLLNPCKSASLDHESLTQEGLNKWKLLVRHLA